MAGKMPVEKFQFITRKIIGKYPYFSNACDAIDELIYASKSIHFYMKMYPMIEEKDRERVLQYIWNDGREYYNYVSIDREFDTCNMTDTRFMYNANYAVVLQRWISAFESYTPRLKYRKSRTDKGRR